MIQVHTSCSVPLPPRSLIALCISCRNVKEGFSGISATGGAVGFGGDSGASGFFRFLELVFAAVGFGVDICGSGSGGGGLASIGGGECDCGVEGGEMEVMSTEGERARLLEDCELGDGVSSGGGGGGNTK